MDQRETNHSFNCPFPLMVIREFTGFKLGCWELERNTVSKTNKKIELKSLKIGCLNSEGGSADGREG